MAFSHMVVLASGTRGDIQPLLALGSGLQAHRPVRMVTHQAFQSLVEATSTAYTELDGDLDALLQQATRAGGLALGGNPIRSIMATLRYLHAAQAVFARMLESAWETCQGAASLIITLPTLWGMQIAEALSVPCACALLQPLTPTRAFPTPFVPLSTLGRYGNHLSHQLASRCLWLPWRAVLSRWRRRIGLRSPLPPGPLAASMAQRIPWVYGISETVLPRPHDWPLEHQLSGYWFLGSSRTWQPPPALAAFLNNKPAPVYIGFGSMGAPHKRELQAIIQALAVRELRALIAVPPDTPLPPHMLALGSTPHDWLFPQVAAVVHHGGAGTTAAALRAGVPQVIAPVAVDQHFWGQRIERLGVGTARFPRQKLDAEQLGLGLDFVVMPDVQRRAAALGAAIRTERGVERAVDLLFDTWRR